jgi:hypothetical protein
MACLLFALLNAGLRLVAREVAAANPVSSLPLGLDIGR